MTQQVKGMNAASRIMGLGRTMALLTAQMMQAAGVAKDMKAKDDDVIWKKNKSAAGAGKRAWRAAMKKRNQAKNRALRRGTK
jgi:hypothetical protein